MLSKQTVIVLQRCYLKPFTLQSQYARDNSREVAELSSRGLITTQVSTEEYGKVWRVNAAGKALLELSV
ncbi:hypothetical protein [Endozoicomonas ascidiicola]|uniref:hypothetical protein n=1 Tax=Endozoicomonas ascidiicola TaxID=1698521 RepID=UPI00083005B7|nr:hypothetical protein [Endozoicomonas ascidiicola]